MVSLRALRRIGLLGLTVVATGAAFGLIADSVGWDFAAEMPGGALRPTSPGASEHMAAVPVRIASHRWVMVAIQLGEVSDPIETMIFDLVGPGYDNARQEFHLRLAPRDSGHWFLRLLPTGSVPSPGEVRARAFYYSSSELRLARLWVVSMNPVLMVAFIVAAILAVLLAAAPFVGRLAPTPTISRARETVLRAWRAIDEPDLTGEVLITVALIFFVYWALSAYVILDHPFIFADENAYAFRSKFGWSVYSSVEGVLTPPLPNLLYFAVYAPVHAFGDRALEAARSLNVLALGAAALPLYRICRRFLKGGLSVALTLAALLGPSSSYAAYFMPESLYVLGFWVVVFALVRFLEQPGVLRLSFLAVSLAALTLIKPHGIMLVPCVALCVAAAPLLRGEFRLVPKHLRFAAAIGALWYAAWFIAAAALAGEMLLSPTGTLYGRIAQQVTELPKDVLRDYALLFVRHASVVMLLVFVPAALLILDLMRTTRVDEDPSTAALRRPLGLFGLLVLGVLMAVTVKFSVDVAGQGPYESLGRLHGRYYSFVLPLIVLVGLASVQRSPLKHRRVVAALFALSSLAICLASALILRSTPSQNIVDFPDALMLLERPAWLLVVVAVQLAATATVVARPEWTRGAYVAFLVLFLPLGRQYVLHTQQGIPPTDVDSAGRILREMVRGDERDEVLILARTLDERPYRLSFYLLSKATTRVFGDTERIDCVSIPDRVRMVAVLDPAEVGCGFERTSRVGQVQLLQRTARGKP